MSQFYISVNNIFFFDGRVLILPLKLNHIILSYEEMLCKEVWYVFDFCITLLELLLREIDCERPSCSSTSQCYLWHTTVIFSHKRELFDIQQYLT